MRFVAKYDEQGNVIGSDAVDDNGVVIRSVLTGQARAQGQRATLPGQTSAPIPGQEGSAGVDEYETEIERRRAEEEAKQEARRAASSGGSDDGGYYVPPSTDQAQVPTQVVAAAPVEQDPYRGGGDSRARQANERRQESLQEDVAKGRGPLRGLGARIRLGLGAAVYGAADAVDDVADFGAAVLDTVRNIEVNDNDNVINPIGRLAQPDSQLGRAGAEIVSFGVTTAAVAAGIAAGAAASIPGFAAAAGTGVAGAATATATRFGLGSVAAAVVGGAARSVAAGAVAGAVTDFVKAKEGEENLYNALKGTPLETPVSRFLAADTDEDSNLLMEKVKAAVGGVPLGVAFDLLGVGAKSALKNYRTAPVEMYLNGLKKAKGASLAEQPKLMLKAAEDTAIVLQKAQESLRTELKLETSKSITETRRLLKGQLNGTEEQGLINAELSTPELNTLDNRPPEVKYQEELEEQIVKAEDLRSALSGIEDPNINKEALDELDASIFDIQDKLDELDISAEIQPESNITRIVSPFDNEVAAARRTQLEKELADVEVELSKVSTGTPPVEENSTVPTKEDATFDSKASGYTEELNTTKAEIQSQLDELNTTPESRDVSPFSSEQGIGSEIPAARVDEPDASLGTREPNIIGGEGVGRVEDVGTASDPFTAPREPQPYQNTYKARSKTEIRRAVASKTVVNRVSSAAADTSTPLFKPDTFKSSLGGGVKGNASERFINTDKLTDSATVRDTIKEVMASLNNYNVADDLTTAEVLKSAQDLVSNIKTLNDDDGRALMLVYGSNTANMQVSNVAARLMVKDLAGQVVDAAAAIPSGKKITAQTTSDMINETDALYKLSRLAHFTIFNKNLGKISGQALRMRGIDLSDVSVAQQLKQADYDDMFTKAEQTTMTADELFNNMRGMLEDPTRRKDFDRLINSIQNAGTPDEVVKAGKLAHFMAVNRKGSKLFQGIRMNNILSGSTSNATNITSNVATTLYTPVTQLAGSVLDAGFSIMKGNKAAYEVDKTVMIQTIGQLGSLHQYVGDSIRMATQTFKTGKNNLEPSRLFDDPTAFDMLDPKSGPVINALATGLSVSLRFMATGDEVFKQLNYRSFVHGKAYEVGMKQGLRGKKLHEYAKGVVADSLFVDEKAGIKGLGLDKEGIEYARFVTFQNEINADTSRLRHGLVDIVETLRRSPIPGVPTVASLFVPFIKTPSNVMAYTARNTPLAFISKEWQNDFAAGGARKARAMGEYAMGSTALMGIVGMGLSGKLQGKLSNDPEERALQLEDGMQEYSIRFPGSKKSISFKRMEPFAGHFSLVADIIQANDRRKTGDEDEWQNSIMASTVIAFVASAKNRTFFEGMTQLIETLDAATSTDEKGYKKVGRIAEDIATTLIPYAGFFNEQRKVRDNTLREANGVVEKFMNKLPGLSDDLPARRSWLTGKPAQYGNNPVLNLYPTAHQKNDPLIKNLLKYNVQISPPEEKLKGVKLTGEQYSRLNELTGTIQIEGKTLYQSLLDTFNSFDKTMLDDELDYIQNNDEYASVTPLATEVRKVRSRYREAANSALVQQYPDLYAKVRQATIESGNVKESMFYLNDPLGSNMGYEVDESDPRFIEQTENVRKKSNTALENLVEGPGAQISSPNILDSLQ